MIPSKPVVVQRYPLFLLPQFNQQINQLLLVSRKFLVNPTITLTNNETEILDRLFCIFQIVFVKRDNF